MTCARCGVDFGTVGPMAMAAPPWSPSAVAKPVSAAAPPVGWRLPPEMDSSWVHRPWPRRHWRALAALTVVLILGVAGAIAVAGFVGTFGGYVRAEMDILSASDGRITNVNFYSTTEGTEFYVYAAPGVGSVEGLDLACRVVRPTLIRDGYGSAGFEVLDRAGDTLATDATPCGEPAPTPSGLNARAHLEPPGR